MKSQLEQLNQYLQKLQLTENFKETENAYWIYQYTDKLTFIEYDGFYDIYWYAGGYGYTTFTKEELPQYQAGKAQQHCMENCIEEGYDCECEYEGYGFSWLLDILMAHPAQVRSLQLHSLDVGANGMRDWDFSRLTESKVTFPNLEFFKIQLYEVGDHNQPLIGDVDGDNGKSVTELLQCMPNLIELEIPGVPNADFFKLSFPKLSRIKVQALWNHYGFIKNLSQSPLLKQLGSLDFMDVIHDEELSYVNPQDKALGKKINAGIEAIKNSDNPAQTKKELERKRLKEAGFSDAEIAFEIDNPNREKAIALFKQFCENEQEVKEYLDHYDHIGRWDEHGESTLEEESIEAYLSDYEINDGHGKRTAFEDYKALFKSPHMPERFHCKLRESYLTQKELFALQSTNKDIQFLHIPTTEDYYVSHRMQDAGEW